MRTTITLDDDVAALIESERARTGESFRSAVNRLLRRGARAGRPAARPALPELPGRPILDVSDVSALLATLDDERRAQRDVA
jgi:phytoene/squalene synthetase